MRLQSAFFTIGIVTAVLCCPINVPHAVAQVSSSSTPEQKVDLAIRKIEAGDLKEAERLINEVSVEKPSLKTLQLARGLLFIAARRYAEAIEDLEAFNADAKGEWRGFAAVGDIYLKSQMYSSAIISLSRAKDIAPVKHDGKSVKAEVLVNLALANVGLKNYKEAIAHAKEARELSPDDADVQLRLAEIALSANDTDTALAAVDRAVLLFKNDIRDDPFNRTAHEKLRQCFRVAAALHETQRRMDPENPDPYVRQSRLLLQASEIERRVTTLDALALVTQGIERAPKSVDARLMVIDLEYALGGIKDSEKMIDQILELDPNNAKALEWREKLRTSPPRANLP